MPEVDILLGCAHIPANQIANHLLALCLAQQFCQGVRLSDRGGADENRLAAFLAVLDQLDNGIVLLKRRPVDLVVVVDPDHVPVGRDIDHVQPVNVHEFVGLVVTGIVRRMQLAPHVLGLVVVHRGDDVPGGAAPGHQVRGLEQARDVEGLVIGGGAGGAGPNGPSGNVPGGAGSSSSINGTSTTYAAGGRTHPTQDNDGGGPAGPANSGNGGAGGSGNTSGSAGGSGIVIIAYEI